MQKEELQHQESAPSMAQALARITWGLTGNSALREDLLQEAAIHLWLIQTRRPNQTRSWYLQSCRFHLQHYLTSGRSIDSAKRREWRETLPVPAEAFDGFWNQVEPEDSVIGAVCARDLMALLARHLNPQERAVLECLADGLGPREIGRRLHVSHTLAITHRRRIASLLTKLDTPNLAPTFSLSPAQFVRGDPRINGNVVAR